MYLRDADERRVGARIRLARLLLGVTTSAHEMGGSSTDKYDDDRSQLGGGGNAPRRPSTASTPSASAGQSQ
jgi:hypothetical protein